MQHRIKQTTSMSKEKANNDFAAFDEYLSQHSKRYRILSCLSGSFLQELTFKRWLGSKK